MVDLLLATFMVVIGYVPATLYDVRFVRGLSGLLFMIVGLFIFSEGIVFNSTVVTVIQTIPNFAVGSFTILMGFLVLLGNMAGANEEDNTPQQKN